MYIDSMCITEVFSSSEGSFKPYQNCSVLTKSWETLYTTGQ